MWPRLCFILLCKHRLSYSHERAQPRRVLNNSKIPASLSSNRLSHELAGSVPGDGNCLFSSICLVMTTPEIAGPTVDEQRVKIPENWSDENHAHCVEIANRHGAILGSVDSMRDGSQLP